MKLRNRLLRSTLLLLITLAISGCQVQLGQLFGSPTATTESLPSPTSTSAPIQPTSTPLPPTETATLEPLTTEEKPETIALNLIKGLRITLVHPWANEAADAFEAVVAEFNSTNALGIEVISRRAGGYEALSEALINGTVKDHMVLTRGFDLENVDDGKTWVNLNDAPGIEGLTQTTQPCSACAEYLDQAHRERYITLLYQPALLYYNQTWARELGFEEAPRTLQDLQVQLQAAATSKINDGDSDNNGTGGLLLSLTPQSTHAWYRAFDGIFSSEDELPVFEREPMEASFNYLKDLRSSSISWPAQNPTSYSKFINRTALAYEGTLDAMLQQEVASEMAKSTDEWVTLPYPTSDGSGSISLETLSISISATYGRVVASSAYFVRWLVAEENQAKLVEATGLWPVAGNPNQLAPAYAEQHPAWASALEPSVRISVAPETKNWGFSRLILQDATMRLYSLDAEFIPTILDTLDKTLIEAGSAQ